MSDEDAFQAKIDENPEDGLPRLVFADWLEERGDPRAEGYRAMVAIGWVPYFLSDPNEDGLRDEWSCGNYPSPADRNGDKSTLPQSWWAEVQAMHVESAPYQIMYTYGRDQFASWASRAEMENIVATAFVDLPPPEKSKILNGAAVAE